MAVVAQITISMNDAGQVNVEGSLDNKLIAYGLLEIAHEVIKQYNDDKERKVQPVTPADITRLRGLDGGRNG